MNVAGVPLEIVQRAVAGDAAAADELVTLAYPEIVRWARAMRRGSPDDVAQEAALAVRRRIGTLNAPENLGRWIYGVVRIESLDRGPWSARSAVPVEDVGVRDHDPAPLADQVVEARADLEAVRAAFESCPADVRQIVELHFIEGMTPARLAFKVGRPHAEVVETLARFRLVAAAHLAGEEDQMAKAPAKPKGNGQKGIDWDNEPRLGKMSHGALARILKVAPSVVAAAAKRRGIEPYEPTPEEKKALDSERAKRAAETKRRNAEAAGKVVPLRQTTRAAALSPVRPDPPPPPPATRPVAEAPPPAAASPWDRVVAGLDEALRDLREQRARLDVQIAEAEAMRDTARGKAERWRDGGPR